MSTSTDSAVMEHKVSISSVPTMRNKAASTRTIPAFTGTGPVCWPPHTQSRLHLYTEGMRHDIECSSWRAHDGIQGINIHSSGSKEGDLPGGCTG